MSSGVVVLKYFTVLEEILEIYTEHTKNSSAVYCWVLRSVKSQSFDQNVTFLSSSVCDELFELLSWATRMVGAVGVFFLKILPLTNFYFNSLTTSFMHYEWVIKAGMKVPASSYESRVNSFGKFHFSIGSVVTSESVYTR